MASKKQIRVKDVLIGGGAPITVQSMTNTNTADVDWYDSLPVFG